MAHSIQSLKYFFSGKKVLDTEISNLMIYSETNNQTKEQLNNTHTHTYAHDVLGIWFIGRWSDNNKYLDSRLNKWCPLRIITELVNEGLAEKQNIKCHVNRILIKMLNMHNKFCK